MDLRQALIEYPAAFTSRSRVLFLLLCASAQAVAATPGAVSVLHHEPLGRLEMTLSQPQGAQKTTDHGPARLSFEAMGRSFDLALESNGAFFATETLASLPQGFAVYRGSLEGSPGSWVRLVVHDGLPSGVLFDGTELYAIESPGDSAIAIDTPVIYRMADTLIASGAMQCDATDLGGDGAGVFEKLVGEVSVSAAKGPGAVSELSIGAVGDYEFTSGQGGDSAAAAAIVSRLNIVDGIYSEAIGVQFSVPLIETFSDSNDPFSDATDPGLFLQDVADYRQSSLAQRGNGLTHLYTGRNLDGSTVGIAFNDVLCQNRVGSGLSEGNAGPTIDALIAAHEIGHNFGAPHDGVAGACEDEPQTFIMAPSVSGNAQFSQCSIDIMSANAARANCISPLATVDLVARLSGQPGTVLLGTTNNLTIDVSNNGASVATNVSVAISLPLQVTFQSATTSAGNCSAGAGIVTCTLGDVAGLSTRTVTLSTTASSVGTGSYGVVVAADFDERPTNNSVAQSLTVDPAVDLEIVTPSARNIDIDQSGTVTLTVRNTSTLDANSVSLTGTVSAGLRLDSASWSAGSCSVAGQSIDCTAASFGNQSSSSLSIGVTAMNAGAQRVTLDLSSAEADSNAANNSVVAAVSVIDPDNPEDSGGAFGIWCCLMAGLLLFRRRIAGCKGAVHGVS